MIAVVLIPPAATVGLGLAWAQPLVSLGAGVLVLVNVLSINLVALVIIWALGYRPQDNIRLEAVRTRIRQRVRLLVLALLVLSIFLGGVTYLSYQATQFEDQAESELTELLDEEPYRELSLLDTAVGTSETTIAFDEAGFAAGGPIQVVVTIDRPAGTEFPEFATELDQRLTQQTGRDVSVEVRYVDADRTANVVATG
ncbi:DUF389 domain-containing protein [Halomarina rubra]|uniref:DUF389 domain-containing protein n=1 Tax=Halomarina rubra TaxID=2071873 RepID=A0ABD6AY49_9EURY